MAAPHSELPVIGYYVVVDIAPGSGRYVRLYPAVRTGRFGNQIAMKRPFRGSLESLVLMAPDQWSKVTLGRKVL